MHIAEIVQSAQDHLTPSQRKTLEYVLDHYDEVAFLSSAALAERIGVSEATVIRLSQSVGFSGFPELRKNLQALVRDHLSTVSRLTRTVGHIKDEQDVVAKVLQQDMDNLGACRRTPW
jgi:DNA-binding MurR/RpiR family transcriptional regulator